MGKKKIMIVDDEVDFLEIIKTRVKSWGYEAMTASSGEEAINALTAKSPDIVILDYIMPDMDGVEALRQIRKVNDKIPVIMFTAHPDMTAIKGAEKLGVSAFIPKLSLYQDTQTVLKTALRMAGKKSGRKRRLTS